MTSEDEEPTTIIDNCADYVSTSIFGPIGNCPQCNADDIDDDDDEGEIVDYRVESTLLNDNPEKDDGESTKRRKDIAAGSIHIIPGTLAKIAKVTKSKKRNGDDDTPSDRGSDVASLDRTLESRLEALLDIIDPETLDHIVVDDGKEISVHLLYDTKNKSIRIMDDETTTQVQLPVVPPEDESTVNLNITNEIEPVQADLEEIEPLPQQSSFADCICPFSSPLSVTNNDTSIDVDDKHVHADEVSGVELGDKSANVTNLECLQHDDTIVHDDNVMAEEQKSNAVSLPVELCNKAISGREEHVDEETNLNLVEVESTKENIIEKSTASPFSLLSYILPIPEDAAADGSSTSNKNDPENVTTCAVMENGIIADYSEIADNTPKQSIQDKEEETNLSIPVIANDSSKSARGAINPPAKWSIFTPFNTSFLDANRNDGTSNKDPNGDQLNDIGVEVEKSSKLSSNCLDPIGSGPISGMLTNSIDKSTTPPWDREDPPTIDKDCTTNSRDIETPEIDPVLLAETEQNNIEQCNDLNESTDKSFDIECTIAGPVESNSSIPTKAIPNFQSPIATICNQLKAKKTSKSLHYRKCSCIILLLCLLLGSLSVGVYFLIQSMNTTTKVVSASTSQSEDSTNGIPTTPINDVKTSRPTSVASPTVSPTLSPNVPPTISPVVKSKSSRAPSSVPISSLKTTNSPSKVAPDPNGTDDSTDDDNSNGKGGNDDDAATGDDNTNDDGSSVSTDDNVGTNDDAGTNDDNSRNNDDATNVGNDDGRNN
jgi:hypothetical protein